LKELANNNFINIAGAWIMKKIAVLLTFFFVLVVFPLFNSGAFADFIGTGALSVDMLSDPVNMFLFSIGIMGLCTNYKRS
jgi:hypothetical protein